MFYLVFRPSDKWKKLSQSISIFKENLKKRETPLEFSFFKWTDKNDRTDGADGAGWIHMVFCN